MRALRILIWHVHGGYLHYLTCRSRHQFFLPSKPGRQGEYTGKWGHLPWGSNVHDIPAEEVKALDLDCVIFQRPNQYLEEQYRILTPEQQRLPRIYIEHDPPQEHPTNSRHVVDDPGMLLVHVTPFNQLMWDSGRTPVRVIDHGVPEREGLRYTGEIAKGIVVVNHIKRRGRRLGFDLYSEAAKEVPLDHVGMGSLDVPGGLGEVLAEDLPEFESRYRFFFNPIRYTSLGLAVCEAMMIGMPIVGLATTEMVTVINNGESGYIDTDIRRLISCMKDLLKNPAEARRLGEGARRYALERFSLNRFTRDWDSALSRVTGVSRHRKPELVGKSGEIL